MGTKGELCAEMGQPTMKFTNFITRKTKEIQISDRVVDDTIVGGHGGGDGGIIAAFYDLLNGIKSKSIGDITDSVKNHMIAFAAERSRLEGRVVEIKEMYK